MQIEDLVAGSGGIGALARELGVSESQAQAGAAALLPAILGGLGKRAPASGAGGIGDLLDQLGGGSLLDAVVAPQPTPVDRGNDVLGQIFGSKDVSRTVASHASAQTGLDTSLLKKMLPMVAMLVTGYLAKRARAGGGAVAGGSSGGGLGDLLGGVLGGMGGARGGGLGGLGGLGAMLDADGNGNPLDDILRQAGRR